MWTNGALSRRDLENQAGVDHLLYFGGKHFRTAIPRTEERAPDDTKRELKGEKDWRCQRANDKKDTNEKETGTRK